MPVRIAIEGNIAAGKSTFLQILAEAGLGFLIVPEPISKWQSLPPDDDVDMPISASQDAGVNILDKVSWRATWSMPGARAGRADSGRAGVFKP